MHVRTNFFSRLMTLVVLVPGLHLLTGISACDDVDADADGWSVGDGDCDDDDASIHPGAEDVCDGIDNDCSGTADDDPEATPISWCVDADHDGYGSSTSCVTSCAQPESGYLADSSDCNDADRTINPESDEVCDGVDENCNGEIDDDPRDGDNYYADYDGDGYGDPDNIINACSGPDNAYDCNDSDATEPHVVDGSSGASSPDGSSTAPWPTIQAGIDAATGCVIVYAGTYQEVLDFHGNSVKVTGVEGADVTVIDGYGYGAAVATFATDETSDAGLEGFTLMNGAGHLDSSSVSKPCGAGATCTTTTNTYCGGGIYVDGASPTLTDLVIEDGELPAEGTVTSGNNTTSTYSRGGGLCFIGARVTLEQVDVLTNSAPNGGGVYLDSRSNVKLYQGFVSGNLATNGGGFYVDGGTLTLENVVSSWNYATGQGGGILAVDGSLTETNVTHGKDDAPTGGGMYLSTASTAEVMNTIVYGADTGAGILADADVTFTGTYNNVYGNAGGNYSGVTDPTGTDGNLSADPLFTGVSDDGDLSNDDWTLQTGSPSIDTGNPSSQYNDADHSVNDQGAFGGRDSDWNG